MIRTVPKPIPAVLLLGTALCIVLFLYFIDEGRYSMQGLFTVEHGAVLGIYLVGLFLGMRWMSRVFSARPAGAGRLLLVLGLGSVVGLTLGLLLVASAGAVSLLWH